MSDKIAKEKMQRIKEQAAKLGTSYYKFVQPFIINVNQQLGKGSYGLVYKGADIRTSTLVAVKTISTSSIKKDAEKFFESLRNQIQIMKALKHPNIVSLFDVKKSSNNIYLFQELCDRGSLEDVLISRKKLPESEVILITKQIISGYKFLHGHKIIHRDLKPANILIKDDTYKIADFGFAKYYAQGAEQQQIQQSLVGSPIYMSPEILNGSSYSTKSDVWSVGIIIYQMLYGRTPHRAGSLEQLVHKVNKKAVRYPEKLHNEELFQILNQMLQYNPEQRIAWKQIFENPLFMENEGKGIQDSMSLAEKSSKNKLEMSTKMNEIYFQDKKIIEQVEVKTENTNMQDQNSINSSDKDVYKQIANKHEQGEVKKAIVRRIRNWFLYKRNKAVFLNHLSLKIHSCFSAGKLDLQLSRAEVFILVLSKWQCMITYRSYIRLKQGKANSKEFSQEEFLMFVKTPYRDKILEKFKNDFSVMKMFFDELVKKVEAYISSFQGPIPDKLIRIKKICNQSLCPKELFSEIFAESIDELNEICQISLKQFPDSRQLIQLCFLVNEALKLKKDELKTTEFSLIYDQEEKLSNTQLISKIQGTYMQSNMID